MVTEEDGRGLTYRLVMVGLSVATEISVSVSSAVDLPTLKQGYWPLDRDFLLGSSADGVFLFSLSAFGSSGVSRSSCKHCGKAFVWVSAPRDDSVREQWKPCPVRVCNQLLDVHNSEESRVETRWGTKHALFRKDVRSKLRTILHLFMTINGPILQI